MSLTTALMFCNSRIWQLSSVPLNSGYIIPVITLFSTSSMFMDTFYFSRSHLQVILDHTMLPYSMLKNSQLLSLDLILPSHPPFIKALVERVLPIIFMASESVPPCLLDVLDGVAPLALINLFFGGVNSVILFRSKFFLITNYVVPTLFTEDLSPQCSAE